MIKGFKGVTITGADDSIAAQKLKAISKDYPFVEWGILHSITKQGLPRFPTQRWIDKLPEGPGMRYSAHLCGRFVRELVTKGNFIWMEDFYRSRAGIFQRIQLNFHGQFHQAHASLSQIMDETGRSYILQCDGVNDDGVLDLVLTKEDTRSPLFDRSGGAGKLPDHWPAAWSGTYCGYAGGLGPDNVIEQLSAIEQAVGGRATFWIDMERNVRSADDSRFDLEKVVRVLELCAEHIDQ